jgi:hypothetical protein
MWLTDVESFQAQYDITAEHACRLKCTAEHLIARCDGGTNAPTNIAAVCWWCNQARHKLSSPPAPKTYRRYVRRRVVTGRWHSPELLQKLDAHGHHPIAERC